MKQVTWGDVGFGFILTTVALLSAMAITVTVLLALGYPDSILGINVTFLVFIAGGSAICLLAARAYPGPMRDFGPLWAWVALAAAVPAFGAVAFVVRGIRSDWSWEILTWWSMQMSFWTPAMVLSIYHNGRDATIELSEAHARDF